MKKRKKKSRPSAGTEDRKDFSVRIAVKTTEGNANDLISKECENLIIQNVLRACKRNKPFDRMVVYQTKEAAEQASKERIKAFPYGTPINKIFRSTSEAFCDSLLAKIESHCDLAEINEMVRTLSYFEKTDTLPKAEKLNQIAVAFGRYVEEEVKKRSNLSGEPTFELTDSIRCLHRLSVILWDMLNAKLPIHKCR